MRAQCCAECCNSHVHRLLRENRGGNHQFSWEVQEGTWKKLELNWALKDEEEFLPERRQNSVLNMLRIKTSSAYQAQEQGRWE